MHTKQKLGHFDGYVVKAKLERSYGKIFILVTKILAARLAQHLIWNIEIFTKKRVARRDI